MKRDELKEIIMESMLEALNTPQQGGQQQQDQIEFARGQRQAVADRRAGYQDGARDMSGYSKAFKKGYKSVYGGWWDKFNNKLTNFVANMGYSRTRGL